MAFYGDPLSGEYAHFGDVARQRCGMQAQYCSWYLDGRNGAPNLAEGLRVLGDPSDYHFVKIHKDDADEFVRRVREFRVSNQLGWGGENP